MAFPQAHSALGGRVTARLGDRQYFSTRLPEPWVKHGNPRLR
jgi:hypothetical protein